MNIEKELRERSESKCELCSEEIELKVYELSPSRNGGADDHLLVCETCFEQIEDPNKVVINHWRCLNNSMWSQCRLFR